MNPCSVISSPSCSTNGPLTFVGGTATYRSWSATFQAVAGANTHQKGLLSRLAISEMHEHFRTLGLLALDRYDLPGLDSHALAFAGSFHSFCDARVAICIDDHIFRQRRSHPRHVQRHVRISEHPRSKDPRRLAAGFFVAVAEQAVESKRCQ